MRIALLGNHQPGVPNPWSTETHWAASFELEGHTVTRIQEGETRALDVPARAADCELFVWVQTYGLAEQGGTRDERQQMLDQLHARGIITVGLHLDRWWGLAREHQIREEPWMRQCYLFTADGAHQDEFHALDINHYWLPPAVYGPECVLGRSNPRYQRDVIFVGSWQGGYHPESRHRHELIQHLRAWYGPRRLGLWPRARQIRGRQLNELYASAKIVVGDSCLVEGDRGYYCSDRLTETLGRGGFLLHPYTEGVVPGLFTPGEHLGAWEAWNWDALHELIESYLADSVERERVRLAGHSWVKQHHTYQHRVREVLEIIGGHREPRQPIRSDHATTPAEV